MSYYHCSPTTNLTVLSPKKPEAFVKRPAVYMSTLLPMALMYGIRNYEYTYGYTASGQLYYAEYFPNALEKLYRGHQASLYLCAPEVVETTDIPNEIICQSNVPIIRETLIPDIYEALLEQQKAGALLIYRYHQLSPAMLQWINEVQTKEILQENLLRTSGAKAEYYRTHYPESWARAERESQA